MTYASVAFLRMKKRKADVLGCLSRHGQHQGKSVKEEFQAHVRKLDLYTRGLFSNTVITLADTATRTSEHAEPTAWKPTIDSKTQTANQ